LFVNSNQSIYCYPSAGNTKTLPKVPNTGETIFDPTVFAGPLHELPSLDLSLPILLDLALVLTEYSDCLSFLKKGVPLE